MPYDTPSEARKLPDRKSSLVLAQSRETGQLVSQDERKSFDLAARSSPFAKSWAHLVGGGLGGMVSASMTAPLDVLKTRLQSDYYQGHLAASRAARGIPHPSSMSLARASLLHIRETFEVLFAVPRIEGWRALFKGLGPNLIGVVPARSINFYTYGNGKRIISTYFNGGQESMWVQLCSAAIAGIVTGTATNPIWLVKTRLQLDKSDAQRGRTRQYRNALDCTVKTVKTEGIRGLYRGLTASYLGVTESTIQWVMYEQMKRALKNRQARLLASGKELTLWDRTVTWTAEMVAAGGAKFFAAILTYPHEVVRTRLRQAPLENGQLKYNGLVQCFRLVAKEEGIAALYGGLVPHMLRVVPSAVIMFGTYESVLRFFGTSSAV